MLRCTDFQLQKKHEIMVKAPFGGQISSKSEQQSLYSRQEGSQKQKPLSPAQFLSMSTSLSQQVVYPAAVHEPGRLLLRDRLTAVK